MHIRSIFLEYEAINSEHYQFFLHTTTPFEWRRKLPTMAERRWLQIHSVLDLDSQQTRWERSFPYFVKSGSACYGHASTESLVCVAPAGSALEKPFLHEETHIVTYMRWGKLPSFFTEGLAHFVERKVAIYGREFEQFRDISASNWVRLFLNETHHWLDFLRNDEQFWQGRTESRPLYLIANHFIDFVATTRGWMFVHQMLDKISSGIDVLDSLATTEHDLMVSWKRFAENEKEVE